MTDLNDYPTYSIDEIRQFLAYYEAQFPEEFQSTVNCREKGLTLTVKLPQKRPVLSGDDPLRPSTIHLSNILTSGPNLAMALMAQIIRTHEASKQVA